MTLAESVLETTLRELGSGGSRAEKVAVTADVADAFARLRKAHEELNRLRDLIDSLGDVARRSGAKLDGTGAGALDE